MALGTVTIRTRLTPPIVLDTDPTAAAPGGWVSFIRPAYRVEALGSIIVEGAPYGEPEPDAWKVALVLLVAAVIGVLWYAFVGWKARR